jgi:hypothetical protein
MGYDVGSWGISINGEHSVFHTDLGQFHPVGALVAPKGTFTLTKIWFTSWYLFDYGK